MRPALLQANNPGAISYLLYGQLLELGQRAGEQSHQEGRRAAHDVDHGRGQDGNEGVLPGEGVQQGHHGVRAAREGAGERGATTLAGVLFCLGHLPLADKPGAFKCKCPRAVTSDCRQPASPSSPCQSRTGHWGSFAHTHLQVT